MRQPSPCVRAFCETCHIWSSTSPFTLPTAVFTLHTSHFTLHTSHFTLHSLHSTLYTSHSTLHSPHFSLLTAFFTLHTSHFTLHTSHFTLQTSHCTLHAPHFTLHSSHSTLHLIWALLTLSQLISSHLISSHMSSKLSWITSQYYYQGTCMRRAPARPVRACFVRSCAVAVLLSKNMTCASTPSKHFPHTSHCTLHTSHLHFTLALHLNSSHLSSSHLISCLPILGSCCFLSRLPWSCLRSVCRGEVCIKDIYDIIIPLDHPLL